MKEIIEIANRILKSNDFSEQDGDKVIINKIDDNTVYACVNSAKRGFGSMIIGKDLTYLWGASSVSYNRLLEEYRKGRRS